jgi:hypothetical protein
MKCNFDVGACLAIAALEEDETRIDFAVLDTYIRKAMEHPAGLTAIELIVPAGEMSSDELLKRHFKIAGSVCKDTVTKIIMKKSLQAPSFADTPRSAFFNPEIATSASVLQPTKEETAAHSNLSASLERHYSDNAVNRRLSAIEQDAAKFKQGRDEASEIIAKANRLAGAIIAGIERKPDPWSDEAKR